MIHVVRQGETVYSIAEQYGVSSQRLIFDNQINSPDRLVIGQALLILFPEITYRVRRGDSLYAIAERYGISAMQILRNNPYLVINSSIREGETLVIKYTGQGGDLYKIEVNGYAYPFIEKPILNENLLYLSELSIFSYGFTAQGELIPANDRELILAADEYGVAPTLVLTPFGDDGKFNNALVTAVTNNYAVRNNLIQNLIETVSSKGYRGVDVDFEYVLPQDRDAYTNFIRELTNRMNDYGYMVSVALVPKTSSNQPGLLYEGIDYKGLGEAANKVLLMTYEWGYTYGPPMAVAPIDKVRQVLDYAVTQIPREKIDVGIPNYGYDWSLPYVKGSSEAIVIGNTQAINIAYQNNAQIKFDNISMSPYFEYNRNGISHIVWFEDVRSISIKLGTVTEYRLRGVGYWTIMKFFRQNWLFINSNYIIL